MTENTNNMFHQRNIDVEIRFRKLIFQFLQYILNQQKCVERIRVLIIFNRPMITLKMMFLN